MKAKAKAKASSKSHHNSSDGPNWILIAGGALLSSLSIRLGYKLKQAIDTKHHDFPDDDSKVSGNGNLRKSSSCRLHSNLYSFNTQDCFNSFSGGGVAADADEHILTESESNAGLPLVTVQVQGGDFNKENGVVWASSPDRLELPPKPFNHHHSNCSDSPCVSESGSDVFSKREVIHKLRQQLKRRDDMISEMQDQIVELQTSLNAQIAHSSHLESQLDSANRELFDSEREIQRLRKAIADHCVGVVHSTDKAPIWPSEAINGHVANGNYEGESHYEAPEKGRADGDKVEMLKKEVGELKEVIEGKDYLLQNYKEQKVELSEMIKDLQNRLDSQLLNIL